MNADAERVDVGSGAGPPLGLPRLQLRRTDSTNTRALELAARGAPHGTLVTATEQTAGRGRQGRSWSAPAGKALLCSLVIRQPPRLLPLAAGVAVAEVVGEQAQVKWPNDVLLRGRKVAGVLVEGRPQEGWAVLGVGLNVALTAEDFPPELAGRATTLGLDSGEIEPTLARLLTALERWTTALPSAVLAVVRSRDALRGNLVAWAGGEGTGDGIDDDGGLIVRTTEGRRALHAGEVHLLESGGSEPRSWPLQDATAMNRDQPEDPQRDVTEFVSQHAAELEPQDVSAFMAEHAKPDDEPGSHLAWAVRVLRERGEGEIGEGLSVDRVADELRRRRH